jgi:spermidine synthase/uncharacterized membrane protein
MRTTALGCLTLLVFLASTLLFGIQPMTGRMLVPYFGGAVHLWLTCVVVFQALLLMGYAWAHWVAPRIGAWHLLLFVIAGLVLPLTIVAEPATDAPLGAVIWAVVRGVGLPFLALSTVSVVAQLWYARSSVGLPGQPYALYAASNAGSLLALLAYPLIMEPLMGVQAQRWIWTAMYGLFVVVAVLSFWVARPVGWGPAQVHEGGVGPGIQPTARDRLWWLVLSSVPSGFLLATTNIIASEMGSFPLVWALPLALYLGSFMVVFRDGGGVPRWLGAIWVEVMFVSIVAYLFGVTTLVGVGLCTLVLLAFTVLLHGELYERRPDARYLTEFYLYMSLGGFIGGGLVTFAAPTLFVGVWEYPLMLGLGIAILAVRHWRQVVGYYRRAHIVPAGLRLTVLTAMVMVIGLSLSVKTSDLQNQLDAYRNFYGVFRVYKHRYEEADITVRQIIHGSTLHGMQIIEPERSLTPTAYYDESQCIAHSFDAVASPRSIGILGLGAGALAGFGRSGDRFDFYEIDPDNEALARRWFTFLEESPAVVSVRVGDGRLLLEQATERYDLLHMDAFSGDGIPSHLLTLEALRIYEQRLAPEGLLLLHISNRFYDLRGVIRATAAIDGWAGVFYETTNTVTPPVAPARCVVLARSAERLDGLVARGWKRLGPGDGSEVMKPWTDDYVNLLGSLRVRRP